MDARASAQGSLLARWVFSTRYQTVWYFSEISKVATPSETSATKGSDSGRASPSSGVTRSASAEGTRIVARTPSQRYGNFPIAFAVEMRRSSVRTPSCGRLEACLRVSVADMRAAQKSPFYYRLALVKPSKRVDNARRPVLAEWRFMSTEMPRCFSWKNSQSNRSSKSGSMPFA